MDLILIGTSVGIALVIFLIGYFTGVNRAKSNFIKLSLKHKISLLKKNKPEDLEYGNK